MKKNDIDTYFKSRSHFFNEMPSDDLWKKIADNLAQEPKLKSNFKKTFFTMALPVITIITVASLYFNNNNSEKNNKTIPINDSIKKENALSVSDSNILLKSSTTTLNKSLLLNKKAVKITTGNISITSVRINNSQSITKKDSIKEETPTEPLRNDKIINPNQLVIESITKTTSSNDLKKEETHTKNIINNNLNKTSELIIKPVESIISTTSKKDIQIFKTVITQEKIYSLDEVHVKPNYPGSINKLYEFINKKFELPKNCPGGRITLTFIVEKDGTLTNIQCIKDIGLGTGTEAIKVLKECRKWEPGKQDGKIVRVLYKLPITLPARTTSDENNQVYNMAGINVQPNFIGGKEKLDGFITQNLQIPTNCPKSKIYVNFIVEKDGSLSNIEILKWISPEGKELDPRIGKLLIKEAIRVLEKCPRWEPGEQNGEKVRVLNSIAINLNSSN